MFKNKLSKKFVKKTCRLALNEDLFPSGDITSRLIKNKTLVKAKLISNDTGIIAGMEFAENTFKIIDKKIKFFSKKKNGQQIKKGDLIAIITGDIKNILIGERVALNFLCHLKVYLLLFCSVFSLRLKTDLYLSKKLLVSSEI